MRALLIYPELPLSFWSFKKSIRFLGKKSMYPPLGLITVAGLLPHEWELRLVDLNTRKLTDEDWQWADLVMISAMFAQSKGLPALVSEARKRGITIVAGGPYPTSLPEELLEMGCDYVVKGEAENTVPLFLEILENGKGPAVIENKEKPDMALSPVPRFDLLHLQDYANFAVQTSRGCPFECEFCDIINLLGRKPRYKDPDQVIKELETLYHLGVRGQIFICDDNFIGNRTKARELLSRIIPWMQERGEPFGFTVQASINLGQDLDMIDLMTAANFGEVFIGIETPDEDILKLTRKFQNTKSPLVETLDNICKNGLTIFGSFIIGFDGEKKGAGNRIQELVDLTHIPICMLNMLHAPINTKLWERLKKEGRLLKEREGGEDGTFSKPNFVTSRPQAEIIKEYAETWTHLYEPSSYFKRLYKYHLNMRPTRAAMARSSGEKHVPKGTKRNLPIRQRLGEWCAFIHLAWRHGILPRHRLLFWRQLFGIWKRNPSRIHKYLVSCVISNDLFAMRDMVRKMAAPN